MSLRAILNAFRRSEQRPPGVLFIGTSFYNNWYASRELRKLGWCADVLMCKGEGADLYVHGWDHYLDESDLAWPDVPTNLGERIRDVTAGFLEHDSSGESRTVRDWWQSRRLARRATLASSQEDLTAEDRGTLIIDLLKALRTEHNRRTLSRLWRALLSLSCPTRVEGQDPIFDLLDRYDVVHFTGRNSIRLLFFISPVLYGSMPLGWDVEVLRRLGKKIVYTNIGCLDGVTQTSFRKWGPHTVCDICRWRDVPEVCSDESNAAWGKIRNRLSDHIVITGGNRVDYNDSPIVHEVPEFYCLDADVWKPDLVIPDEHRLDDAPGVVRIYHGVGDYKARTRESTSNIKTTHIIMPLVEELKAEGYPVDLVFCTDVPNLDVRFYQAQSDIVVDMLTFGFFGANIREAMMLGKPAVCFIRPEWLESVRAELPGYADELPVVSATPETIRDVLVSLVTDPAKRQEIGRKSRAFAMRWHASEVGAARLDRLYNELLSEDPGA